MGGELRLRHGRQVEVERRRRRNNCRNVRGRQPPGRCALFGVAFDGANIWTANQLDDTVTELRASDGALLGTFQVGDGPIAVAFDGSNIWVANSLSNNVTKLRASDGANLGTFAVGSGPRGIAFDGVNIWVA